MSDLREAAQQALEALERYQVKRQDFDRFADEITALRAALAQQAEPVAQLSIEELARALVLTRIIDSAAIDDPHGYDDGVTMLRIVALHRKLAQQAEPVALDIKPPNPEGATLCTVRWIAETTHGWVGSWDRAALEHLSTPPADPEVQRLRDLLSRAYYALSAAEEEADWPMYASKVDAVKEMLDAAIKAVEGEKG